MENKTMYIVIAILLILGGGYFLLSPNSNETEQASAPASDSIATAPSTATEEMKDADMMEDSADKEEMNDEKEEPASQAKAAGSYEAYSASKLSRASNGTVLLFFHADWCPSCRTLDKNINASSGEIPAGVTILKTDYDKESALKKKYGVTYQHTIVQVDADGNMINKWSGGSDLASVINKAS